MKSSRIQELKDLRETLKDSLDNGAAKDEQKTSRIIDKINSRIGDDAEISDLALKLYMQEDEIEDDFYKEDYGSYSGYRMEDEEDGSNFSFEKSSLFD
jgi:hypothetical protein